MVHAYFILEISFQIDYNANQIYYFDELLLYFYSEHIQSMLLNVAILKFIYRICKIYGIEK